MRIQRTIIAIGLFAAAATMSVAQERAGKEVVTIPKAQYQQLLDEHRKLLDEMEEMKAFKAKFEEAQKEVVTRQDETDQSLDELDKQIKANEQMGEDSAPGSTRFLLTGYGDAGFISQNHGGAQAFSAAFNPILLWKLSDKLLFEGELEAELEGSETSIALELAQISYVVNDYVTFGAGKFLNPMNYFVERQHQAWVNKFPDKPLAVYDGLLAETQLGVQIRGGIPIGETKVGYAFYVSNAHALNADPGSVDPTELGTVTFDNFDNVGDHIAVGGRIGFLPIPELEIGYGFQFADVAPPQTRSVNSFMQSVDMSYVSDLEQLAGIINFKAQWVWTHIDRFTYDPNDTVGGPFNFTNNRDGGYVQLAYRPSRVGNALLKNVEPVFRYDNLSQAKTLTGVDETRYSFGMNYWIGPSSVFKAAYEIDHQSGPEADDHDGVLLQFATGF